MTIFSKSLSSAAMMAAAMFSSLLISSFAFANVYPTPAPGNNLIGKVEYLHPKKEDTFDAIAKRTDTGIDQISEANPELEKTTYLSQDVIVKLPTEHIIPNDVPHKGIVINLPEMRMYYFPHGDKTNVITYPIGIGRVNKTIPIENTYVKAKKLNPSWRPPQDIREFNLDQGIVLPKVMGPGPDNPLGPYAIYLGIPTFLIHSTIHPDSIGTRASFGCIRMYVPDVQQLFKEVAIGMPVTIIDMPAKIGWQGNRVYLENHAPLEETSSPTADAKGIVRSLATRLPLNRTMIVDWQLVDYLARNPDGVPHEVGFSLN